MKVSGYLCLFCKYLLYNDFKLWDLLYDSMEVIFIKSLIVQFKRKPLLTTFMLLCFIISSFMVFVISSMITNEKENIQKQNFGYNEDQTMTYSLELHSKATYKDFIQPIDKLKDDYLLFFYKEVVPPIEGIPVQAVIFCSNTTNLTLPISQGNFLKDNVKDSIVVGKTLYEKLNNPSEIKVFKTPLKVGGICDEMYQNSILLYREAVESFLSKDPSFSNTSIVVRIIKMDGKISDTDRKYVLDIFSKCNNVSSFEFWGKKRNSLSSAAYLTKKDTTLNSMLLLIGAFNIIVISTFWIEDRKKEISIRKAFGAESKDIIILVYKELGFIMILAIVISLLLQILLLNPLSLFLRFKLSLSPLYLIFIIIVSFGLTILSSLIPITKALKMQISQCLKE